MKTKNDIKLIKYFWKMIWNMNPGFIGVMLGSCVIHGFFPFVNVIFPMYIIDELVTHKRIDVLATYIFIMAFLDGFYFLINQRLEVSKKMRNEKLMMDIKLSLSEKFVNTDYRNLESAEFLDLESKALFSILYQNSLVEVFDEVSRIIVDIIRICGLTMLISILNPWIVIFLLTSSLIYIWCYKKLAGLAYVFHRELEPINRKFTYYIHMVTDYKRAKDIRLYNAEPMISEKIGNYNIETYSKLQELCRWNAKFGCIGKTSIALQKVVTYGYVTYLVVKKSIALGGFVMYVNAISQLVDSVNDAVKNFIDFRQNCDYLEDYKKLIELCDYKKETEKEVHETKKVPSLVESVEFRGVSFSYKNSKDATLKNVSFVLEKGSRTAIVGKNGAGKSTVMKLLLRFFEPDEGRILLNGIDIRCFEIKEYREKISAVFQEFFLPSASIRDNITIGTEGEKERLERAVNFSGISEFVQKLGKKMDTMIGKEFDEHGIELSGGQRQSLAIARMIYKGAQIVLLDEPTAALDPKREEEIYQRIYKMSKQGKEGLLVFISHRLSSCRFCDKILVFHDGELYEIGTHEELIQKDGIYAKMWNAQKQYYESA